MSEAFDRGRDWERSVFKIMSKMLRIPVKRDSKSGAGLHKADGRDQFSLVPLFVECKDQEKLNLKTDWRIASSKASVGFAPVVVFPDQDKMLCVMDFKSLLNIVRESMDWQETAETLRQPDQQAATSSPSTTTTQSQIAGALAVDKFCPSGHIVGQWNYCLQVGCKYSRGYRVPKGKDKYAKK